MKLSAGKKHQLQQNKLPSHRRATDEIAATKSIINTNSRPKDTKVIFRMYIVRTWII